MSDIPNGGTLFYRMGEVEKDIADLERRGEARYEELSKKVDRLLWGVLTLALTIAGSAVVFAITVAVLKGGAAP